MNIPVKVFIGIGSNIGNSLENCEIAVERLKRLEGFFVRKMSSWYRTEPVGFKEQEWFVNGVVMGDSLLDAESLLRELQNIEKEMGRVRKVKWGPRVIDLDILSYGDQLIHLPHLKVPHPELPNRRFVLEPLCEVDPDWRHPLMGLTACKMLEKLPCGEQRVERIDVV